MHYIEKELRKLHKIYKDEYEPTFPVPEFFTYITDGKVKKAKTEHDHRIVGCPMQFIYDSVNNESNRKRSPNGIPLSDILINTDTSDANTKVVNDVLNKAGSINNKRNKLNSQFRTNQFRFHNMSIQNAISRETISFFRSIKQEKLASETILALINEIDIKGTKITEADWLLLAALCNSGKNGEINFSPNDNAGFFGMLKKSGSEEQSYGEIKSRICEMFGI